MLIEDTCSKYWIAMILGQLLWCLFEVSSSLRRFCWSNLRHCWSNWWLVLSKPRITTSIFSSWLSLSCLGGSDASSWIRNHEGCRSRNHLWIVRLCFFFFCLSTSPLGSVTDYNLVLCYLWRVFPEAFWRHCSRFPPFAWPSCSNQRWVKSTS